MKRTFAEATLVLAALAALACAAWAEPPVKKFLTADGKRPEALFAAGIAVGKTVYVAGKGDYRPNEEIAGKVKNCLAEVRKTLQVAGLDLGNVVHSFCYLEDRAYLAEFDRVYAEHFPGTPPARTLVGVPNVPGDSRIEITCIAYADPKEMKPIGKPSPGAPFTPGIAAGDMVYLSGMDNRRKDGKSPERFDDRMRQAMKNTEAALKAAKIDFRHAVMMHVFLDNPANATAAAAVYREFFKKGEEPSLAVVPVDWIPGDSRVLVTCWAVRDLKTRKAVRPASLEAVATGLFFPASPAVWAGDTLYLSALDGRNPADGTIPENVGDQVRAMAGNHRAALEAAGLSFADIVSGHVYLRTIDDYAPMNAVYKEFYSAGPGVRICLMPTSKSGASTPAVAASFIAARTK